MLNISIFDVTYSNYGKYLESNVFMQKQKMKLKKQREEGDIQEVDNKTRTKNMYGSSTKTNNYLSTSVPGTTLNQKAVSFGAQPGKKNPFFSSQKNQNASLNQTIGGTVGARDGKNALHMSFIGMQGNPLDRPRTTSLGTAVFRSVERSKTPGFCHFFHRENNSEIKYQPKYDLISEKAPAFSISKAEQERMIDSMPQRIETTKDDVIPICKKNSLLKDVQELEVRVQLEQDREKNDYGYKRGDREKENKLQHRHSHLDTSGHLTHSENTDSPSNTQKNHEQKKRNSKLSANGYPQSDSFDKSPKFHLQPKSYYVQKALRYKYISQVNYSTATEANSPSNNLYTNQSQLMKRSSISPTATNHNFSAAAAVQSNNSGVKIQQRPSIQKRKSLFEGKTASNSNNPSLHTITNNILKDSNQLYQLPNQNNTSKDKAKNLDLTQPKETKIGALTDGQTLAYAEVMNTKDSFYGQTHKRGFHVKLDKQTNRPSTVKRPVSQDEMRFNNFQLLTVKQDKAHPFTSYTQRRVFEPKDNAPSYDIHKVNYDRLLTNDHHNKGNVSLDQKPIDKIPISKHEIVNQNMYSNLKNNEVLNASVRLDYPLKDSAYFKQSGVKRPQTVNFGKSSPRKKSLFPKPEGTFKDYVGGNTEGIDLGPAFNSGRQSQGHTIAFYQPGEMTSTNQNNNNQNNLSWNS